MQGLGRPVSLPLEKFHSATTARAEEPVQWVLHPQPDNLFCVLNRAEANNGRSQHWLLKVVSRAEVLEELDLGMLVQTEPVKGVGRSAEQTLVSGRSISTAVRPPLIAIKYKKAFGQFRLFQMRFTNDAGYQAALSVLMQAHVQISFIAGAPKPQALAQRSWGSQGMTRPIHRDAMAHRGLAQQVSTTGNVPNGAMLWDYTGAPASAYANTKPPDDSQPLSQPSRARLISTAPADINSGLGPQATMRNFRVGSAWTSPSLTVAPTRPEPHRYPAFSRNGNSVIAAPRAEPDPPSEEFFAPFRLPSMIPETPSYTGPPSVCSQQMSSPELPHNVPISTLEFQLEMGLIMPPRRELPFAKPAPSRKPKSSPAGAEVRSPISRLQLPELPRPTLRPLSKGAAALCEPNRGGGRPEVGPSEGLPRKSSPLHIPRRGPSSTSLTSASIPDPVSGPTLTSGIGHHKTLPGPRLSKDTSGLLVSKNQAVDPLASTAKAAPASEQSFPQVPLQDRDLRYMDDFLQKHMHYDQPAAPNDLSRLASLSNEDRQAEIETMICDLIHDEDFYKLLEGVENSWQRIGFDLHR
ncbi:MAG: hypothetical protein M1839_009600 [Geoglossum umbratile]|nr:MAG: hypothetical protein M1839_009600 [Geoglossum umbratile]